jgi:hypothetical protein
MRKTKWMELETAVENDCVSAFWAIETRKALLETNKFPNLKAQLETEVAEFEQHFDSLFPLYEMAQKHAAADRERQEAAKALKTPANGQ